MDPTGAPARAIGVLRSRIEKLAADHYAAIERGVLAWYDGLSDKYGTTLQELETERATADVRVGRYLKELGYE